MADEDAMKIVMLRKYAAIYGRFDSKRKNEKRMSLHEASAAPWQGASHHNCI